MYLLRLLVVYIIGFALTSYGNGNNDLNLDIANTDLNNELNIDEFDTDDLDSFGNKNGVGIVLSVIYFLKSNI